MECQFCRQKRSRGHDYHGIDVCRRCYTNLQIDTLKDTDAPPDPYLTSRVNEEDTMYVDALSLYATLFPRTMAFDLLGICIANLDDEEMNDVTIISMIMAARAVWMFGTEKGQDRHIKDRMLHTLHVLGNLVGISMMCGGLERGGKDRGEEEMARIMADVDERIEDVIWNLREHDDGTLGPLLDDLEPAIFG